MTINITSRFESGNIEVLDAKEASDIRLKIKSDSAADFFQWFYFRVETEPGRRKMTIENAGRASYAFGWEDYQTCASTDLKTWVRVPTRYEGGQLIIEHECRERVCYYAYFAPYTTDDSMRMIASVAGEEGVDRLPLGYSHDERPIDCLRFGKPDELKRKIWVIARQHPGESMGSWFAEGVCETLLDTENDLAVSLLREATVYVVPMMNPDGVARGHLRTNAVGTDLNRAWEDPTLEKSPEVFCVRTEMERVGCDLFLDAHGDEAIANNFIAGSEGIPSWSPQLADLLGAFKGKMIEATPDFQDKEGYPVDGAGKANLRIACNWVAQRFGCLSMTLEMPFKDAKSNPKPQEGWSPRRCKELARTTVGVISRVSERLR